MKPLSERTTRCATLAALAAAAALFTGCASEPKLGTQWSDPQRTAMPVLSGQRVLIACNADDKAILQVCQDRLAEEISARGATPVFAPADTVLTTDRAIDGQLLPSARRAGAQALFVVTLTPSASEVSSGLSIGIGGFSVGRGSGVGVGVSAPLGGGRVTTGYAANGRVTDTETGRLVWTATASAPPSADVPAQLGALARVVVDAAVKAGLF